MTERKPTENDREFLKKNYGQREEKKTTYRRKGGKQKHLLTESDKEEKNLLTKRREKSLLTKRGEKNLLTKRRVKQKPD